MYVLQKTGITNEGTSTSVKGKPKGKDSSTHGYGCKLRECLIPWSRATKENQQTKEAQLKGRAIPNDKDRYQSAYWS